MPVTFTGKGGVPYLTEKAAAESYADSSSTGAVTHTNQSTGQVFLSERDKASDQYDREKRGW